MTNEPTHPEPHSTSTERHGLSNKLDAVGWGLSLIWIGVAFLADVGWGWGLLGIAAIILGETALRWVTDLNIEGFWVVVGFMFLAGALWELFHVPWPLAPIVIIGCGLAIVWGAVSGKDIKDMLRN